MHKLLHQARRLNEVEAARLRAEKSKLQLEQEVGGETGDVVVCLVSESCATNVCGLALCFHDACVKLKPNNNMKYFNF
jgi:hypothetical protein